MLLLYVVCHLHVTDETRLWHNQWTEQNCIYSST